MLFRSIFLLSLVLVYAVFFIVPPAEGLGNLVRIIYSNFAHPKQACNNAQQGNVTP